MVSFGSSLAMQLGPCSLEASASHLQLSVFSFNLDKAAWNGIFATYCLACSLWFGNFAVRAFRQLAAAWGRSFRSFSGEQLSASLSLNLGALSFRLRSLVLEERKLSSLAFRGPPCAPFLWGKACEELPPKGEC